MLETIETENKDVFGVIALVYIFDKEFFSCLESKSVFWKQMNKQMQISLSMKKN